MGKRKKVEREAGMETRAKESFLQLAPFQVMSCPRPARRHRN
jgi:hypothetical protein